MDYDEISWIIFDQKKHILAKADSLLYTHTLSDVMKFIEDNFCKDDDILKRSDEFDPRVDMSRIEKCRDQVMKQTEEAVEKLSEEKLSEKQDEKED